MPLIKIGKLAIDTDEIAQIIDGAAQCHYESSTVNLCREKASIANTSSVAIVLKKGHKIETAHAETVKAIRDFVASLPESSQGVNATGVVGASGAEAAGRSAKERVTE